MKKLKPRVAVAQVMAAVEQLVRNGNPETLRWLIRINAIVVNNATSTPRRCCTCCEVCHGQRH